MTSNVIFIHPDGADPSHFAAARFETVGPDGRLNWDEAPEAAVYLGHLDDQIVPTSNAGAVVHAYGIKATADSFGLDDDGVEFVSLAAEQGLSATETPDDATILEEAAAAGRPTALINSGFIAEPGTGVFFADAFDRDDRAGITAQLFFELGDDDFDADGNIVIDPTNPQARFNVILGAGEVDYLPEGTVGVFGEEGTRTDGLNLIEIAEDLGYEVVFTLEELQALPANTELVLGIFAAEDTYNDVPETALINNGFVDADGELITYGQPTTESNVDDEGFALDINGDGFTDPPTVGDLLEATLALDVFADEGDADGEGFFIVLEEEATDNFGNNNNARGAIDATLRADEAIGAAQDFIANVQPNTFVITAADSAGGSLEIDDILSGETVGSTFAQPILDETGNLAATEIDFDGTTGSDTTPFVSAPDANGNSFDFGIAWAGLPDFAGSIVTKAFGEGADRLPSTIDNTAIYRLMYESLFGVSLDAPAGVPDDLSPRQAPEPTADTGNVIFIHPDGTSPSHYAAARFASVGTDGRLNWDQLSDAGVYLGHIEDRLVASSNAGAVAHAYGIKAFNESFGFDAPIAEGGEEIVALDGTQNTIMQQAQAAGKAIGIINSGFIAEPGTGAFLADVDDRDLTEDITAEILEQLPDVVLGGGETDYLPVGTIGFFGEEGTRTDGRNLIEEAEALGYEVVFTLEQLQAVDTDTTDRLLGIFAAEDTYNDTFEDSLEAQGLVDENGDPIFFGQPPLNPNPPTVAQMLEVALPILSRDPDGFFLVLEEEATDNFGNNNNAAGTIEAAIRADEAIGVALDFVDNIDPNTLVITAADSDAGGLEIDDVPIGGAFGLTEPESDFTIRTQAELVPFGPAADGTLVELDDTNGSGDGDFVPFTTGAPDANGDFFDFGVAWATFTDVNGGIVTKTYGLNSDLLPATADNTDIYRIMFETLFGITPEQAAVFLENATGTSGDDLLFGGANIASSDQTIVTGAGEDVIDLNFAGADAGDNIVLSGSGEDDIFTSNDDIVFGGTGADAIAVLGEGGRISGGADADSFLVEEEASNNRILGGDGDDDFFFTSGSDNIMSGGEGADSFEFIADQSVADNVIVDFDALEDSIAISDLSGIGGELEFDGSDVIFGGVTIVTLVGLDAANAGVEFVPAPPVV